MQCPNCGQEIGIKREFCPACGKRVIVAFEEIAASVHVDAALGKDRENSAKTGHVDFNVEIAEYGGF